MPKKEPQGVPSIKQVLPAEKAKGVRAFCSYSFSHVLSCKVIVCYTFQMNCRATMSLLCVKGGGSRKRDGGIVKNKIIPKNNPSVTFGDSSLYTSLFYVHLCLVNFPDKHCFCGHKSEAPRKAGRFLFYITFILLTKLLID